jgi:hypothetical protein
MGNSIRECSGHCGGDINCLKNLYKKDGKTFYPRRNHKVGN